MMIRTVILLSLLSVAACQSPPQPQAAASPSTPGATSRTIVPGDNSSIAGDAGATRKQQTEMLGGSR